MKALQVLCVTLSLCWQAMPYSALKAAPPAAAKVRPVNVVFVLADDMGWNDWSPNRPLGIKQPNSSIKTPNLAQLADEGMTFTNAYSNAVCSPTRVSFLTGMNEATHGVTNWTYLYDGPPDRAHPTLTFGEWNYNGLQPEPGINHTWTQVTLPEFFRSAGYRTMIFGKGHFGTPNSPGQDPATLGFDVRLGGRDAGGPGSYSGLKKFAAGGHLESMWRAHDVEAYFGQDIHLSEVLTLEAVKAIRQSHADGKPFFCYLAHYAPHAPLEVDARFHPPGTPTDLDRNELAHRTLVQGVDKSVGDIVHELKQLGIENETLVIFQSDNGANLSMDMRSNYFPNDMSSHNAPLSSGKGSHREGGIRVPLIARWPGKIPRESVSETPVIIYDWFPTFRDLITQTSERSAVELTSELPVFDGVSLLPLLTGEVNDLPRRPLVWHMPNFWGGASSSNRKHALGMGPSSAIRLGDVKLIYYHETQRFELFDLKEDLSETRNLAETSPERVKELASELTAYLNERHATFPVRTSDGQPIPDPQAAASMSPAVRLLFAGSSSTYWNDLPQEVAKVVEKHVHGHQGRPVAAEIVGRSGDDIRVYSLPGFDRYEYGVVEGQTFLDKLRDEDHEFVCLMATCRFIMGEGNPKQESPDHATALRNYCDVIRARGGEPVFYEVGWGKSEREAQGRARIRDLAASLGVKYYAPCSTAWARVYEERPDFPLQHPHDSTHPGDHGHFLNLACFYAALTQTSPVGKLPRSFHVWPHFTKEDKVRLADELDAKQATFAPSVYQSRLPSWMQRNAAAGLTAQISEDDACYLEQVAWETWQEIDRELNE